MRQIFKIKKNQKLKQKRNKKFRCTVNNTLKNYQNNQITQCLLHSANTLCLIVKYTYRNDKNVILKQPMRFLTCSLLSPTKPPPICITHAIRRLYMPLLGCIWDFQAASIILLKMCSPLRQETQFCIVKQSARNQNIKQ